MIVATPAGAKRRVHFEHRIDNPKRVLNNRIICAANTVTNQFEKTGIDDLFGRKFNPRAGRLIREDQRPVIWISLENLSKSISTICLIEECKPR
jgi:hypothetical protein